MKSDTANEACRMVAELLVRCGGCRRVVASPGSRNAPLLVAMKRREELEVTMVIDERSAGFIALGMALITGEPVALVCTSGTALLNYAPAVAEAYYRRLPLVVISADRPMEWIDQDDSQTIRQPGALANYVKMNVDIPARMDGNLRWYANRVINDALIAARSPRRAPVHINIQIDAPLGRLAPASEDCQRVIEVTRPAEGIAPGMMRILADEVMNARKVMVIAGFMTPDPELRRALKALASHDNIVVFTETISNLHSDTFLCAIDSVLSVMTDDEREQMRPDLVITLGGALVSRHIKEYMRKYSPAAHWHVGVETATIDCFRSLTRRIEIAPDAFFPELAAAVDAMAQDSKYAGRWRVLKNRAFALHQSYVARSPWSDMRAFEAITSLIPRNWNVQLSNGTPIRYGQLFGYRRYFSRCDCNRGVSGIDGCTSTAVGASIVATDKVTLLITGDMSAQYDIGALACNAVTPRFKMIVMVNGGGAIFRFVESTRDLPEREECFCMSTRLPLRQLADGYGFAYFEVSDEAELREAFITFAEESSRPAILAINTPAEVSARVLRDYFSRK